MIDLKKLDYSAYRAALHLAPWLVPLSAALVFGVSYAQESQAVLGHYAWIAGGLAALGLELSGILFFHIAILNLARGRLLPGAVAGVMGSLGYLVLGAIVVSGLESSGAVAYVPYVLVVFSNLARALGWDLDRAEGQETEAAAQIAAESQLDLEIKKAQAMARIDTERQVALAKQDANKAARLERIRAKAAQSGPEAAPGRPRAALGGPSTAQSGPSTALERAALEMLDEHGPEISGAELGRLLGKPERTGRKLKTKLLSLNGSVQNGR